MNIKKKLPFDDEIEKNVLEYFVEHRMSASKIWRMFYSNSITHRTFQRYLKDNIPDLQQYKSLRQNTTRKELV